MTSTTVSKAKLFESLDSGLNCVGEPPTCNINTVQPNMKTLLDASVTSRDQSFTSLMADLRQDINRVSSFTRRLNETLS